MIQKLSIAINLKFINECDNFAEKNKVGQSKNDLIDQAFSEDIYQILDKSIKKLTHLQEIVLSEFLLAESKNSIYMNKFINVDEVLELINPQIKNWTEFMKKFESFAEPDINKLQKIINSETYKFFPRSDKFKAAKIIFRNLF